MNSDNKSLEELIKLFNISKKNELLKHCKNLRVMKDDFANMIILAHEGMLPYMHIMNHRDIVPDHLIPNVEDKHAIKNNGIGFLNDKGKKWVRKIDQLFVERRFLTGHLFFTENFDYWHFFYFDQRDLSIDNNHWGCGSHIHLINWLWPEYTAKSIWKHFIDGNPIMKGSVHIQYIDLIKDETTSHNYS